MGSFSAASYWVCPSPGLSFVRLLGKDHLQGLLLQQVIGEIPFVGPSRLTLSCSKLLGKDRLQGLLLQQAIGEIPFVGLFFQQAIGQNSCAIPFIIYIIYNIEYWVYNILHTIYNI